MKILANATVLLLSTALALLVAEVAFRVFLPISSSSQQSLATDYGEFIMKVESYQSTPGQNREFFQYHPLFGHIGVPSHSGLLAGHKTTTNSKGYRDIEHSYAKPAGVKRVVLLGDSEVWGIGVSDEDTISAKLTEVLNNKNSEYEVINLGISGYGVDQSYLQFIVEGKYYSPDYVVFVFYAENDIRETSSTSAWGIEKPIFYVDRQNLCLGNMPPRRASGWINNRLGRIFETAPSPAPGRIASAVPASALFTFFAERELNPALINIVHAIGLEKHAVNRKDGPLDRLIREEPCLTPTVPPDHRERIEAFELTVALIERLKNKVNAAGAKLLVVGKPRLKDYQQGDTNWQEYRDFEIRVRQQGLDFVDMMAIGKAQALTATDFFGNGRHLSARGHFLVAKEIESWIDTPEDKAAQWR